MDGSLVAESSGVAGRGQHVPAGHPGACRRANATAAGDAVAGPSVAAIAGRRVLVVDDNATNLRILVGAARTAGPGRHRHGVPAPRRVDLATVGPADFEAVLTDLRMPELDGLELAAAIRASRACLGRRRSSSCRRSASATATPTAWRPSSRNRSSPRSLRDAVVSALTGIPIHAASSRSAERLAIDRELGVRHPLRILLAEDNAGEPEAGRSGCSSGWATRADIAADGLEAIAAVERGSYDVVLMDVQMPELDGLEATRRIRARWPDRPLRIVAMTANAMEGDRETCLAAGMDDYLSKPIRPEELALALTPCRWRRVWRRALPLRLPPQSQLRCSCRCASARRRAREWRLGRRPGGARPPAGDDRRRQGVPGRARRHVPGRRAGPARGDARRSGGGGRRRPRPAGPLAQDRIARTWAP